MPCVPQIPSKEQVEGLSAELGERGRAVPAHVHNVLQALPKDTHPMTQFSTAVLALQVLVCDTCGMAILHPARPF